MAVKERDPLAPIEFIATVLGGLLVAWGLLLVAFTVAGSSTSFLGFGDASICVELKPGQGASYRFAGDFNRGGFDLAEGATQDISEVRVCAEDPGVGDRLLYSVHEGASLPFFLGFLLLLRLVVRRARRSGLFTLHVAGAVRLLGWYLVVGTIAVWLAEGAAGAALLTRWINDDGRFDLFNLPASFSWPSLIGGFAALTVGRVMERTVPMQEELDATV